MAEMEEGKTLTALAPGIYYDIPFDEYCKIPALNISTLDWGKYSAEHLKAALDGKLTKDSQAMNFGRAVHARLLEPDVYATTFSVSPGCQEPLKSGKRKGEPCGCSAVYHVEGGKWLCGKHAWEGMEPAPNVLTQEEAERVEAMAHKIKSHKVVRLLRQRGGFEATVIWETEGILCKGRLDKLVPRNDKLAPVIVDLKKCRLGYARKDKFQKEIDAYNYAAKAAWYCDAVTNLTNDPPTFVWIAIEEDYPHGILALGATRKDILVGRSQYRELLSKYLVGKNSGEWQGYSNEIEWGGLPDRVIDYYLGT
jgi:exodeoxyribonuclease VIII